MAQGDHFDWDDRKAASNLAKHRVTFEEAQWVFDDERSITIVVENHSRHEDRWITIGLSSRGNLIVVVHSDEIIVVVDSDVPERIRIISARRATKHETLQYKKSST